MKRIKQILVAMALLVAPLAMAVPVKAATTVAVRPATLEVPTSFTDIGTSWYFYNDNTSTPSVAETANQQFVNDQASIGNGSLKFNLTSSGDRWTIATNQFAGVDLNDLTALSFDMYVPATSAGGTTWTMFLNLDVDFYNNQTDGYKGRLVYVPQDNDTPTTNTWETWDAIDGGNALWKWSRFTNGWDNSVVTTTDNNKWPDGNLNELRTTNDIKSAFPNLEIFNEGGVGGQLVIRAGHPGPNALVNYVDKVVVNDTTFDMEMNYQNTGSIVTPVSGETVSGTYMLSATYSDGDFDNDDDVNWGVRPNSASCTTGTNYFGGGSLVSGVQNSSVVSWDGATFEAIIDTTLLEDGSYCFVFNPTDDNTPDVREYVSFNVDNRADNKDECKNGGWMKGLNLTTPFKNQGDCVSYFATGTKNAPSTKMTNNPKF